MPLVEAYEGGQELNFPWGAIRTMGEIVGDPHLDDRNFFVPVEHPELGKEFTYPGPAAIYNASPWRISRRAPLIGEHNDEVLGGELGLSKGELEALKKSGAI
jgi:crotonobetainyl-CoA:carnitine CoA-transferase CaiB-like acyl-CoA transferase